MNYNLEKYTLPELKKMAVKMELPMRRSKSEMIQNISDAFKEYEEYKKEKLDKYTKYEQLGDKGKEGVTYLVKDRHGKEYAMKTFRKDKSSNTLNTEYYLQKKAARAGISPNVYDCDTVSKYIVMDKMDRHLYDEIKRKGYLSKKYQERILFIFQKLDKVGVFHGDANILNYMIRDREVYIIDFGFSKEITPQLQKKLGTDNPNYILMTVGLILKLKELGMKENSYKYLKKSLPVEYVQKYKI
jgi:tRNA A-37 threonylcarbamoyl transferase component Bud32